MTLRLVISRLRFFFFFLRWRLGRAHYFHSVDQDKSTVAQQAETIVKLRRLWPNVPLQDACELISG